MSSHENGNTIQEVMLLNLKSLSHGEKTDCSNFDVLFSS